MDSGYCEAHKRAERKRDDERRGTAASRGYNSRWQKARATYLRSHPLCVECLKNHTVRAANTVDHVVAHKGDQKLFWSVENWQALCGPCNSAKAAREEGGFGNPILARRP